ncbi:GNAT family N-acetyltransferase [Nocardiopsis composta]
MAGPGAPGAGYGTEMRAAALHLGFAELGAATARSEAMSDNPASLAVSGKLGYRTNGTARLAVSGRLREEVRLLLERADWERNRAVPVRAEGSPRAWPCSARTPPRRAPRRTGPEKTRRIPPRPRHDPRPATCPLVNEGPRRET